LKEKLGFGKTESDVG